MLNKYTFTEHAKSEDAILFGVKICDVDWLFLGQDVELYDKNLKQTFLFNLYQVEIDNSYYSFAAYELDTDEWLFYTIK